MNIAIGLLATLQGSAWQRPGCLGGWPGYGYLWWVGSINNGAAPSVNTPTRPFLCRGLPGQYAFVISAHNLVVVHRAPHLPGGPSLRKIGRLLWLLLDARSFPTLGLMPRSSEAARYARAKGEALSRNLPGKTLLFGYTATYGPYRFRLNSDGSAVVLTGREPTELDTASGKYEGTNSAASGTRSNRTTCASRSSAMDQIINFSMTRA
jgi:hypothetical protein